jgi:hypothetical protein
VFVKDAWSSMEAPQNLQQSTGSLRPSTAIAQTQQLYRCGICKSKREKVVECAPAGSDAWFRVDFHKLLEWVGRACERNVDAPPHATIVADDLTQTENSMCIWDKNVFGFV